MAINYTVSNTFSPNTVIASAQVNTNFSDNANTWTGLEALTKSFAKLKVDVDPTTALEVATKQYVDHYSTYRRPVLQFNSTTVANAETGINGTSGQLQILFPDGTLRTDSTTTRIQCNLAQVAALTGTAQSGLQTGTVSTNTWYWIYAVKSQVNSTDIVLVADKTNGPVQASYTTLNSNFGTSGWVYLGLIRNGDGGGTNNNVILNFTMNGNRTMFRNTLASADTNGTYPGTGIRMATTATNPLTYTYAAGTGTAQVPANVGLVDWAGEDFTSLTGVQDAGAVRYYGNFGATNVLFYRWSSPAAEGVKLTGANFMDVMLTGFTDVVLGAGANALL